MVEGFEKMRAPVPEMREDKSNESSVEESIFGDEKKFIVYLRDNCIFPHLQRKSSHYVNMAEHLKHFWHIRPIQDGLLHSVRYYTAPSCSYGYPFATNVVSNIPRMSFSKTVFDAEGPAAGSEKRPMVRPEQKLVSIMPQIDQKFLMVEDIVVDPDKRTAATAKAYLVEPKPCKFTGSDSDGDCFREMKASLQETFAFQVLIRN